MSKIIGISGISDAGTTTITNALGAELSATCLFWNDFDDVPLERRLIRDFTNNLAEILDELQWYLDTKASADLVCDGDLPVDDIVCEIRKNLHATKT